jgi:thymidine phosphorylase
MAEESGIGNGEELCRKSLLTGRAMDFFVGMIEAQGGDLAAFEALPQAPCIHEIRAERTGYWCGPDAMAVGRAVRAIGGGRFRMEDRIYPFSGWVQEIPCGTPVENGQILGSIHGRTAEECSSAAGVVSDSFKWDRPSEKLVLKEVR